MDTFNLKPLDSKYTYVSFGTSKFYTFKKENIYPTGYLNKILYLVEHGVYSEYIQVQGEYDKDKKILNIEINQKFLKEYNRLLNKQKLERFGQSFLTAKKE